jgi:hypothetical protein
VAIDSVGYDFLHAEYDDYPRRPGVDDYLHEAALADAPPSGTFYDPDHATRRNASPAWVSTSTGTIPLEKQYSRNLGTGTGIELVPVEMA